MEVNRDSWNNNIRDNNIFGSTIASTTSTSTSTSTTTSATSTSTSVTVSTTSTSTTSTSSTSTSTTIGQSFAIFDGSSSYINIPGSEFNYPTGGSTNNYALSFSVWFDTTSSGVIFGQDAGVLPPGASGGYVPAIYVDTNGDVRASMFWHGATSYQIVSSTPYNDGKWHNLVDTYNNGVETLYIDGSNIGSISYPEQGYSATYDYFLGTGCVSGWPSIGSGWSYLHSTLSNVQVTTPASPLLK